MGLIRRSMLELRNTGTSINSFNSKLYHSCVGQFGAVTIPVFLSDITFCSTFPRITNGGKTFKFSQGMVNAFTCKAPGFG